jgi:hypothetical protein
MNAGPMSLMRHFCLFLILVVLMHLCVIVFRLFEDESPQLNNYFEFISSHFLTPEVVGASIVAIAGLMAADCATNKTGMVKMLTRVTVFLAAAWMSTVGFLKFGAPSQMTGYPPLDFLLIETPLVLALSAFIYPIVSRSSSRAS